MVQPHAIATDNLPSFITAPGETDVLMVLMTVILALAVMGFGIAFLRLHTLPERIAHRRHKLQFEIVAVLGLIALFTHMHIFWIAGLLLALIDLPDFSTPLNRIAGSAEKLAGLPPGDSDEIELPGINQHGEIATEGSSNANGQKASASQEVIPTSQKELSHA